MSNLKLLREERGLSQADVAKALNVSAQAVSKWERGESEPKWSQAPKLAKLFACSIDALFEHKGVGRTAS